MMTLKIVRKRMTTTRTNVIPVTVTLIVIAINTPATEKERL